MTRRFLAATLVLASLPLIAPIWAQTAPMQRGDEAMPAKPPVPASKSVNVTFEGHTTVFTVADLMKFKQVTLKVKNEHRGVLCRFRVDFPWKLLTFVICAGLVQTIWN